MNFTPKRVVGYGCSFTAGEETSDHIIAGISEEEMDLVKMRGGSADVNSEYVVLLDSARQKWLDEKKKMGEEIPCYEVLRRWYDFLYEKYNENSYIRHLADIYGISWKNRAIPGGTNEQIVYRIQEDMCCDLLAEGDLVICGLTSFSRVFWLEKIADGRIAEKTHVYRNHLEGDEDAEFKHIFNTYFNPYYITWTICQTLKMLNTLGQELEQKGIKLVIIPILFNKERDIADLMIKDKNTFPKSKNWDPRDFLNKSGVFDSKYYKNVDNFVTWMYSYTPHGWGHPKATTHKRFAKEYLYNVLEDDLWFEQRYKNINTYEYKLKQKLAALRKRDTFIYR